MFLSLPGQICQNRLFRHPERPPGLLPITPLESRKLRRIHDMSSIRVYPPEVRLADDVVSWCVSIA